MSKLFLFLFYLSLFLLWYCGNVLHLGRLLHDNLLSLHHLLRRRAVYPLQHVSQSRLRPVYRPCRLVAFNPVAPNPNLGASHFLFGRLQSLKPSKDISTSCLSSSQKMPFYEMIQKLPISDTAKAQDLELLKETQENYRNLDVSLESKCYVQDTLQEMISLGSKSQSSSAFFYWDFLTFRESLDCGIPSTFLTLLRHKFNLKPYPLIVESISKSFFEASKCLQSSNQKRLFYFHMIYRTLDILEPLRRDQTSKVTNELLISDQIVSSALDVISLVKDSYRSDFNMVTDFTRLPLYVLEDESFRLFFLNNPKACQFSGDILPDGYAMDLFPVGIDGFKCSGRSVLGLINKKELVLQAMKVGEGFLQDLPSEVKEYFILGLMFFYKGSSKSDSYFHDDEHCCFNKWLNTFDWSSMPTVDISTFSALISLTDDALRYLFDQNKGEAFSARKILKAMESSSLDSKLFLRLLVSIYQVHRFVLEDAFQATQFKLYYDTLSAPSHHGRLSFDVPELDDPDLKFSNSLFVRDAVNCVSYSKLKGRFEFTPEMELLFENLEKMVLSRDIPSSEPFFIGWNGSIQSFVDSFLSKGIKPDESYADQDLGKGLYVTPSVSVAEYFAIAAAQASLDEASVSVINAVYVPFLSINFDTGLPKGTVVINDHTKAQAVLHEPSVCNLSMRDFRVSELRINVNKLPSLNFSVRGCKVSAELKFVPPDFFSG